MGSFRTMDHLSPEEALQEHFTSAEPGFIWGKTWEYCWFKGTVILPKAAEGKRIVMNLDAGGESTVFVNGKAFGNYRAAWVDDHISLLKITVWQSAEKKATPMRF